MGEWIARNWWMLWALFVVATLVAYRMRRRGGDEFFLRRIVFALFPQSDPANPHRREVTPVTIMLVLGGIFFIALMLAMVTLLGS